MAKIKRFLHSESAATAVEYAVLLALIIFACFAAIQLVGFAAAGHWNHSAASIDSALN